MKPGAGTLLGNDEVEVTLVVLPLARAFALPHPGLDAGENQRAARFVYEIDRARYVASHLVLRHVLGRHLGRAPAAVAFAPVPAGAKPRLVEADRSDVRSRLRFNLSQSGALALVAVARTVEVGIDVEEAAAIDRTPIEGQLASGEQAALAALVGEERRAAMRRLWVRKEAYLKARGTGLQEPLAGFEMSVGEAPRLLSTRDDPQEAARWAVVTIDVPAGYAAALVHGADGAVHVTVRDLPWSEIEP